MRQAWGRLTRAQTSAGPMLSIAIRAIWALAALVMIASPAVRAQTASAATPDPEQAAIANNVEAPADAPPDDCSNAPACQPVDCADGHMCGRKEDDCAVWYRQTDEVRFLRPY